MQTRTVKTINKSILLVVVLSLLGLVWAVPGWTVSADHPTPNPLLAAGFEQKLNAQLPLGLTFQDETGKVVRLGNYFEMKPVILLFAYYECPMLCSLVMNDLLKTLRAIEFDAGDQFEVITVSMDPRETPELAASKKAAFIKEYGRPGAEQGWHFLTGEQDSIHQLADTVGFQYAYDEEKDEYAHPAGIMILTPEGKVSRYFAGIEYPPSDVRLSLVEASEKKIGTAIDQFFLLCYAYDPVTGKYTLLVKNVMRLAGAALATALSALVGVMVWQERRTSKRQRKIEPTLLGTSNDRSIASKKE